FLVEDGLLMNIIDENGKNARAITETGKAKGIIAVERTLEDGKRYFTPFYPPEVQAYILMRVMNYEL
uniref:hypothetical protein n=1 Tax=Candidatus Symbiothrix dinenymphae TaxID=467085 RepID=UPI000AA84CD1